MPGELSSEEEGPRVASNWHHNSVAGSCSFPRRMRLHLNREFQQVYKKGTRRHGKGFSIIFSPNGGTYSRLGISVQRKVGSAVRRNRIKRLFREAFRLHREQFPQTSDIVITVRPDFSCDRLADLEHEIAGLLHRGKPV